MLCKKCRVKIADIDIYCQSCGTPSESYKKQFRLQAILQSAKDAKMPIESSFGIYTISIAILIVAIVVVFGFSVVLPALSETASYYILNASLVFVIPLLILPLQNTIDPRVGFRIDFSHYPRLALFVFFVAIYFWFLKLICQGDPILNLVRVILVLWGLAIVFPVPYLIFSKDEPVHKLIYKAYLGGKYLRWHQFFLSCILAFRLIVSALLVFALFPSAIQNVFFTMRSWHQRQESFLLYDKDKNY
jgi:hypothetical protein